MWALPSEKDGVVRGGRLVQAIRFADDQAITVPKKVCNE